jgi:NAD(P)-dependent dehydrogenase (short-subunit alcohol dehydrogenase family)
MFEATSQNAIVSAELNKETRMQQRKDRVVVVTGAANGIGWATAQRWAAEGYCVALLDMSGESVMARATELGPAHMGLTCDVASESAVAAAITCVMARFDRIDVLVNNAGIGDQTGATVTQNVVAFDRVLAVHLRGTFLMSQAVARVMLMGTPDAKRQRGAIVNIGSIAGSTGLPARNAYSAAKAGIVGMTRAMASEWARDGIRVNAVAPGYVRTSLVEELERKGALDASGISHRTPMGRMAEPAEIAEAIVFLGSHQASYITGAVLPVDGGWTAFGAPESTLRQLEELAA